MKRQYFLKLMKKVLLYILIAGGISCVFLTGITTAEDLPAFRQGMWEFNRTFEETGSPSPGKPQKMKSNKCMNPTEDMKKKNEAYTKNGCKFSPISKKGNTYSYTADCKTQDVAGQSKITITVKNDSAYSLKIVTRSGKQRTKESVQAKRTGDCKD